MVLKDTGLNITQGGGESSKGDSGGEATDLGVKPSKCSILKA